MSYTTATVSSTSSLPCHATISVSDVYPHGYTVPDGFQVVGFRRALPGERFIYPASEAVKAKDFRTASSGTASISPYPRIIISELPKKCVIDSCGYIHSETPAKAPAGFKFTGEYRSVQKGETYMWPGPGRAYDIWDLEKETYSPYWILKPLPIRPAKAPEGYEFTGKYKTVHKSEYFYNFSIDNAFEWIWDEPSSTPHWILRPVKTPPAPPTPESIYGTKTPKAPAGWYLGEFGLLKDGEYFLCSAYGSGVVEVFRDSEFIPNTYRYVLHRIPTLHDIYGTYNPVIPVGYESTGEIKRLEIGDTFVSPHSFRNGFTDGGYTVLAHDCNLGEFRLILRKLPTPKRWVVEIEEKLGANITQEIQLGRQWMTITDAKILSVTEKNKYTEDAQGGAR